MTNKWMILKLLIRSKQRRNVGKKSSKLIDRLIDRLKKQLH